MSTKMICDYCLREVTANYTRMSVQTINADGTTAEAVTDDFEFHPTCYNALQGLIVQMRSAQDAAPIDPRPGAPAQQPTNPDDPEPVVPPIREPTPATPDVPVPSEPAPEPAAPTDPTPSDPAPVADTSTEVATTVDPPPADPTTEVTRG